MKFTVGTPKPKGSGIKKGQKQLKTLLKEERRAIFDAEISQIWKDTIKKLRPEYVADQFIGKAQDNLDVTTGGRPIPLFDNITHVQNNHGHKQDTSTDE